jgi:hypothetical protein
MGKIEKAPRFWADIKPLMKGAWFPGRKPLTRELSMN